MSILPFLDNAVCPRIYICTCNFCSLDKTALFVLIFVDEKLRFLFRVDEIASVVSYRRQMRRLTDSVRANSRCDVCLAQSVCLPRKERAEADQSGELIGRVASSKVSTPGI